MRVLVASPYLPHRRVGHGGGTAVRDLLKWLARRHEVTAACLVRPGEEGLLDEVRELGVTVAGLAYRDRGATGPGRAALLGERSAASVRALASGYPVYVEKYWNRRLAAGLARVVADTRPEVIQFEYLQMSLHCRDLARAPAGSRPRLVLNTHELGSLPRERRAELATTWAARRAARVEAARWRRLQVDACGWADRTLCVTPQDRSLLAAMGGTRLSTVPLGMDLDSVRADWDAGNEGCRLLFVGSFQHAPNRSGARALLQDAWPAIRGAFPSATLDLAGRGSREFLAGLGGEGSWAAQGVTAHGFVEDLAPLFRSCRAFVAHLTEGGGIKIKVLEAMARGVPVVCTPVAAEGITAAGDDAPVIAPAGEPFAAAVTRVATDRALARTVAAAGRRIIEDRFGWEAIVEQLSGIYAGQAE